MGVKEDRSIIYLTMASPQSMTWHTINDAIGYGIAAKVSNFFTGRLIVGQGGGTVK
jgi:hypothetical protein